MDTAININATILPTIGLTVCANLVLLCHIFAQVQSDLVQNNDVHPAPIVFKVALEIASHITQQQLCETIVGNSE